MTSAYQSGRPLSASDGDFRARVVGTVVAITVALALVSPRTIPFTMSVLAVAVLGTAWARGRIDAFRPRFEAAEWLMLGLIVFSLISIFWAFKPKDVFLPVFTAFGYFCGAVFMANVIRQEDRNYAFRLAEGLWLGLILGLAYLAFEIATGQVLKLHIYNALHIPKSWLRPPGYFTWHGDRLAVISPQDLTRSICPITPLLWAALPATGYIFPGRRALYLAAGLFAFTLVVVMISEHETSKVAIIWGAAVFMVARASRVWGDRLLRIGWVLACLAVIPITMTLHRLEFHNAHWLQPSLRHRIIIWNHTSEETMKSPIFGIGAGMMYQIDPNGVKMDPDEEFSRASPHAHNVYLQTWFELGAIGIALLTLFGLAVIERIRNLQPEVVPFAQACFASGMAVAAASYGAWQPWYISMFEMSFVMMAIAISLSRSNGAGAPAVTAEGAAPLPA